LDYKLGKLAHDRIKPGQNGCDLGHAPSLLVGLVQRHLAPHRTLRVRVQKAAVPERVRPSSRGKASGAALDVRTVNIGLRLALLGGKLKAGNAPRSGKKARFRTPRAVAGDLKQLRQVTDLADLVDLALHQRDPLGGLAGMDVDALVARSDRHLVGRRDITVTCVSPGQFATRRIKASARLFRSASWRVSAPSPRSRSASNALAAETRAAAGAEVSTMILARITLGSTVVGSILTPPRGLALARPRLAHPLPNAPRARPPPPPRPARLDAGALYLSPPATSETSETSETNPEQDRSVGAASS